MDLNDTEKVIISRSNRLVKLIELNAPDEIVKNELFLITQGIVDLIRERARTGDDQDCRTRTK